MAKRRKTHDLNETDFPTDYVARWRADIAALYCSELMRRADIAGLLHSPAMLEKIRQAEIDAATLHATAGKDEAAQNMLPP